MHDMKSRGKMEIQRELLDIMEKAIKGKDFLTARQLELYIKFLYYT